MGGGVTERERGERGEGAKMDGGRGQTTEERTVIISNGRDGRSVGRSEEEEEGEGQGLRLAGRKHDTYTL